MADLQPAPIKQIPMHDGKSFLPPWVRWFQLLRDKVNTITATTKRIATATYTVLFTDSVIFFDTDSTAITVTLPAGSADYDYTFKNVGSSGNNITLVPNGIEIVEDATIYDGESFHLRSDTTEGWKVL
tara:strand:- start:686 stop:1069 length:384 start_codon:yes stop_codon:yes gene_type:complete